MKLTRQFVESIDRPGRYSDDRVPGLMLFVQRRRTKYGAESITRSYVQRLTVNGKRIDIGLGAAKWTTLTEVRKAGAANYRTVLAGGDPRVGAKSVPTFAEALEKVLDVQRGVWRKGSKSEAQWRASLRDYAGALMGKRVDAIGPGDVLAVLTPIWNDKRETASRVRQRISAVMRWSIAEGHRKDNPVDAIGAALPRNGVEKTHHKALPYEQVGDALAAVRASGAWAGTRLAFEFLVLTAARSGEVRGARWEEMDLESRTWTVPGARMKSNREHKVPLSDRAMEVLAGARELGDGEDLVFPSATGRVMSNVTLSAMMKRLGIDAVPHGFRSSFRDWANERTNTAHAIMEAALAHVIRDKTVAAYSRSDLLEKRRDLMNAWSDYVAGRDEQA
ncbi:MAG: site-specific integrase [Rhodospirillaceae bacterium]|nr:site-specific integrase [Rhodospirillaceae bacterium]